MLHLILHFHLFRTLVIGLVELFPQSFGEVVVDVLIVPVVLEHLHRGLFSSALLRCPIRRLKLRGKEQVGGVRGDGCDALVK